MPENATISSKRWLIMGMYKQQHSLEEIFHLLTTGTETEIEEKNPTDKVEINQVEEDEDNA